jgi:hypothetical protein
MVYLVKADAVCWDAGSLMPSSAACTEVLPTKRAAMSHFRGVLARVKGHAEREVETILAEPEHFVFDSGYSYYAIVIQLPQSTKRLIGWPGPTRMVMGQRDFTSLPSQVRT